MTYLPAVGEFFVVRTGGWAGRGIRWITKSTVNHAGIHIGAGSTLEAKPVAPWIGHVTDYPGAIWAGQVNPALVPTEEQGKRILAAALLHTKDTYSWFDCACIAWTKLTRGHVPAFIRSRLENPHRNLCSQLVDRVYHDAGIELYDDGRLPGDVSPGDLLLLLTPVH